MARMLIVDDDHNSRKIVELMLLNLDLTLAFAEHGEEAVARAIADPPDLILMDILMPVMNGLEATRRIKAHPATARVPIVALTALAFDSDRRDTLDAGCDNYLAKPFTRRDLLAMVGQYLPQREPVSVLAEPAS